ncbi:MAG: Gfo/Idh/MocA family oxidoreductase [Phycisphaeraceae bacterium]|nr:Gfo/Idh/MocA family oxidoreductase [Phycisphaeraceae bacterium]
MLNVAIVGLGGIGNNHAECYKKNANTKLVAVCDIIKERADKAAAAHNAQAFYSVADMLKSGVKIDAASVTTAGRENGGDHYQPTMELLAAGIPVLGEKPISNEVPKAREMVELAKKKNLPYGINLNHRFTPASKRAREWMQAGRLGEINMISMFMWINNPNETAEHFHIRALHPHSIDVMRYFCGDVKRVHAFFKKGPGRKCWSNVHVNMQFESGVIGHLMGSYDGGGPGHQWSLERCEVMGQDARFVLTDACEVLEFQPRKSIETETYRYLGGMRSFGETFPSRINAWIDDLMNKTPIDKIDAKGEDALKAQLVIEAAVESWDKGTVVEVK